MKRLFISVLGFLPATMLFGQQHHPLRDTIRTELLQQVLITSTIRAGIAEHLPDVQGVYIFAGKRTNTIQPGAVNANLAQNVARMAFAQIPGLNIWEMDGAGTQVNIGSRSTDTHRSIEMNMRQNGYNTNSDMFGYPEDHYTPPMQGIQQVQLVRGSAALQFGPQFGGMMNYQMKEGDSAKSFGIESEQTKGSYGFFNSFNAVGGTAGKINYYAYYDNRSGDGWRPNARFNYHAYYFAANYHFSSKGSIAFQFSRMDYVQQIAGGLTDAQFAANPKQSLRSRNFFNPEINIPAVIFNYHFGEATTLEISAHTLFGQRNSVQFINTSNIADTINTSLGTLNPRQVDRDYYNGYVAEARLLHRYSVWGMKTVLTGGLRYSAELTRRKQKGLGTIAGDFDLQLTHPYGIDLRLHTNNYAAFAENLFQITPDFSVTPGVRYEIINSNMLGVINNATFPVAYTGNRNFPLFGTGLQYQLNQGMQLYANISQAYRPYLYASITPADQIGIIDPNLTDSRGYDIDFGYRGHVQNFLHFDIDAFYLFYGNRVGQLTLTHPDSSNYLFTTNVGNSVAKGVEAYVEFSISRAAGIGNPSFNLSVFNSLSYDHARYITGAINNGGKNVSLVGNRVEGTPDWIDRGGLKLEYKTFSTNVQYSYTSDGYSDANNTALNATGATGYVPAYHVWDWAANYNFARHYHVSAGLNNIADTKYFTRRINMYPGPGILPADGRTFYVSLGLKL